MGKPKEMDFFEDLKRNYGINLAWLARRIGLSDSKFQYRRHDGEFTKEQREIMESALRSVGRYLSSIEMPEDPKQVVFVEELQALLDKYNLFPEINADFDNKKVAVNFVGGGFPEPIFFISSEIKSND